MSGQDPTPPPVLLARARVKAGNWGGWGVAYIDRNGGNPWTTKQAAFSTWDEAMAAALTLVSCQRHIDAYCPKQTALRRRTPSQRRRDKVIARDGATCRLCGATEDLTLDHYLPSSKGGTNDLNNLILLCKPCNFAKADRMPMTQRLTIVKDVS